MVVLALVAIWTWYAGLNPYWPVICVAFAGFSLYRSYKAFVEVWRSHLSKRVEIEVMADNPVYRTKEATDEVAAADERILPGSYSGHELAFEMPAAAAPSTSGEITNVEWKIRVTLVVRGMPDVIKEIPLTVLSSSESRLPGRSFRVGERIEGSLVLTPRQDFKARTLRVEVARTELVSRESGNVSERSEASEVVDESPRHETWPSREYPFAMHVPESAGPCLETDLTSVGWWLRATVERRMAFDPNVQLSLNVYNGQTTAEH